MISQIPLIYIASNGHSGSTLLDLLLGAHPNMWTLGEAQNLPWEIRNKRAPCGCGIAVDEDDFWLSVLDRISVDLDGYHVGYFRNIAQVGKVLRWNILPDIFRNEISDDWRPAVQEYGSKNLAYFQAVKEEAEVRTGNEITWLVDNSKDPYRLYWLQHSGMFSIRAIHLIKDPRAFVFSMVKRQSEITVQGVLRYTLRWIVENAVIARVVRKSIFDENVQSVAYEELATRPRHVMKVIGQWLCVDYDPNLVQSFRSYENHALSGNMMRWRRSEDAIRLDESWKTDLPGWAKELVIRLTRPFSAICGYSYQ